MATLSQVFPISTSRTTPPAPVPVPSDRQIPLFHGLRAILAVAIVVEQCGLIPFSPQLATWFLTLSGFFMAWSWNRDASAKNFFTRRSISLLPPLTIFLALTLAGRELLSLPTGLLTVGAVWILGLEALFTIAFPLVARLGRPGLLLIVAGALLSRIALQQLGLSSELLLWMRVDALAMGMCAALIVRKGRLSLLRLLSRTPAVALCLGLLLTSAVATAIIPGYIETVGVVVDAALLAVLTVQMMHNASRFSILDGPIPRRIGTLAYGIIALPALPIAAVSLAPAIPIWCAALAVAALSIPLAGMMQQVVELPLRSAVAKPTAKLRPIAA